MLSREFFWEVWLQVRHFPAFHWNILNLLLLVWIDVHWFELLFPDLIYSKDLEKKKGSCQSLSCWQDRDTWPGSKLPFLLLVWEELQKTKNWKCRDCLVGCSGSSDSRLSMGQYPNGKCLLLLLLILHCFAVFFSEYITVSNSSSFFLVLFFYRLHTKRVRFKLYTAHCF